MYIVCVYIYIVYVYNNIYMYMAREREREGYCCCLVQYYPVSRCQLPALKQMTTCLANMVSEKIYTNQRTVCMV